MKNSSNRNAPDRVILLEIGLILALLFVNWFMALGYETKPLPPQDPDPIIEATWWPIPEYEEEKIPEKKEEEPEEVKFEPLDLTSKITLVDKLKELKFEKKDIKHPPTRVKLINFPLSNSNRIDSFPEVFPQFEGGEEALAQLIKDEFIVSESYFFIEETIQVIVSFVIDKNGRMTDIQVVNCSQPGLGIEQEAIRVIGKAQNWTPGETGGKPINCRMLQPIKLNEY